MKTSLGFRVLYMQTRRKKKLKRRKNKLQEISIGEIKKISDTRYVECQQEIMDHHLLM
jgi:hypothetical protein